MYIYSKNGSTLVLYRLGSSCNGVSSQGGSPFEVGLGFQVLVLTIFSFGRQRKESSIWRVSRMWMSW